MIKDFGWGEYPVGRCDRRAAPYKRGAEGPGSGMQGWELELKGEGGA